MPAGWRCRRWLWAAVGRMPGGHRATSHGGRGARRWDERAEGHGCPPGGDAGVGYGPRSGGCQAATERRAMEGEERGDGMSEPKGMDARRVARPALGMGRRRADARRPPSDEPWRVRSEEMG